MRQAGRHTWNSARIKYFRVSTAGPNCEIAVENPSRSYLDEFASARSDSLAELRALKLQQADFLRRGNHPALGVVTLSELVAAWAAHDLTHMHQVTRIMAHQYREAVGPWIAYLGVLKCAGHSSP